MPNIVVRLVTILHLGKHRSSWSGANKLLTGTRMLSSYAHS